MMKNGKNLVRTESEKHTPASTGRRFWVRRMHSIMNTAPTVSGMPMMAEDPRTVALRNTSANAFAAFFPSPVLSFTAPMQSQARMRSDSARGSFTRYPKATDVMVAAVWWSPFSKYTISETRTADSPRPRKESLNHSSSARR